MFSPPDNVDECIMFLGCPIVLLACLFVYSFVQSDIVTTISHQQLEQF